MATLQMTEDEYGKGNAMTLITAEAEDDNGSSSGQRLQEITVDDASNPTGSPKGVQYPSGLQFWLIMFNLGAVSALTAIDMNIIATAVPRMTDYFHTVADVGWYASAFRLCQCAFQFLFGKAYTLYSAKRIFLLANFIWIIGLVLCGAATSSTVFIIGRAIAGLGTAGLDAGSLVILVQSTPLSKRPLFLGFQGAIEGIAVLLGPLLGGVITQYLTWRWCFYISLPFGGACLLITLCCLSDSPKARNKTLKEKIWQLDIVSNLLFIPALTCLFLALTWGGTKYAWNSGRIIGLFVTFAVLLVAFAYKQYRRGDNAALPLRILRCRTVIASVLFVFLLNSAGNILDYYLPTYFQVAHGYTPAQSGYLMIPIIIGGTLGAVVHGIGTSVCGQYGPFMLFASTVMPVAAGLITTFKVNTNLVRLITFTGLSGLAYGSGICGPQLAIQIVLPSEDVPLGLSVALFAHAFGPAVAIAVAQVLLITQVLTNISFVPGLNRTVIDKKGLMDIVTDVPPAQSSKVREGIAKSLSQTWYLVVGLASASMIGALLVEWRSIKSNNSERPQSREDDSSPPKSRVDKQQEKADRQSGQSHDGAHTVEEALNDVLIK